MDKLGDSKPKRRLKDPETFRQRALKAAEAKDKPADKDAKPKVRSRVFGRLFKPVKSTFSKLRKVKQLKPIFVVLAILGRILWPKYIRTSIEELKKVTWPGWKQSRKLTYAVLIFAIVFGAAVASVDWGLGKLFKHILLK